MTLLVRADESGFHVETEATVRRGAKSADGGGRAGWYGPGRPVAPPPRRPAAPPPARSRVQQQLRSLHLRGQVEQLDSEGAFYYILVIFIVHI